MNGHKHIPTKKSPKSSPSRSSTKSSPSRLSSRASIIKRSLKEKIEVDAVVINVDGKYDQIKYSSSSKQVNKILGGRPSIVGELEEIQTVIVRSLNQTNCGPLNKAVLPVPFCNKQYNGNYLLYRLDAGGNPINLTVKQYEQYVADTKTLTEMARKNYNPVDNQEIKAHSSFNSNSRLTLVYLRSEVDKKVRAEFEKKNGKKPTDAEIEGEVNAEVQKLVDDLVSKSSPLNDPDYNPEDEDETYDPSNSSDKRLAKKDEAETKQFEQDNEYIGKLRTIYEDENGASLTNKDLMRSLQTSQKIIAEEEDGFIDDRDWRLQLNDALNYVRERGRLDGSVLAEKISETYYELNGAEPTLDQLVDVFRRIKNELAIEADDDISRDERSAGDDGSAYSLAKKLGHDLSSADPSDLVDYAFRIVREDMLCRAKSSFNISKGRDPSKYELQESVERLALKLAEEALTQSGGKVVADDEDEDELYDPDNVDDTILAKEDAMETRYFDQDFFNLRMLTTAGTKSRGGRSTTYDVYFCKFSKKRQARNLKRAIVSFQLRNKREPNQLEIAQIKQFISCKDTTKLIEFKLSVVGDSDDELGNDAEEKAEIEESAKHKGPTTPSKVLVTPVKEKKTAKRYSVYFKEADNSDKNEKMALKWFKRFNNRDPTELELAGIKQFTKTDKSHLTECEYEIPNELIGDDDCKDTEEDDTIFRKMRTKDFIYKKDNKSTGYTLNFGQGRESGDGKQALKWFKRFNNRNPTDAEIEKIKQFIKSDEQGNISVQ